MQVPVTVGEEEGLTLILDLHTNLATFGRYNLEDFWDIIRIYEFLQAISYPFVVSSERVYSVTEDSTAFSLFLGGKAEFPVLKVNLLDKGS